MRNKKGISILLCFVIMISVLCCPLSPSAIVDYSYKIDSALVEKIENIDDGDTVEVSLWLDDIDEDTINQAIIQEMNNRDINENVKTLFEISNHEISSYNDPEYDNISIEDVDEWKQIERKVKSNLYLKENKKNFFRIV